MVKHPRDSQDGTASRGPARGTRTRPLPVRDAVRLRGYGDGWYMRGFSGAVAFLVPGLVLLAAGRLDLILYTSAGTMCALYAHGLPYAARARTLLWLVLGMTASLAVAMTAAALTDSAPLLVLGAALVAAVHKTACDATRIGPPNNVVLTFLAATVFFVPQQPAEIPFHLALQLAGGALAWLICMAPVLVRPYGPERIATARALEAAARSLRAEPTDDAALHSARHATAAAVDAGRRTLALVPHRARSRTGPRAGLEPLLLRAESVLATAPGTPAGARTTEAALLDGWAYELRKGRPVPEARPVPVPGHRPPRHHPGPDRPRGLRPVLLQFRPGSPLLPIGVRTGIGCALAGWASLALGVGHPYWAVVTAASVFQANTTLSWHRVVQRTLGNVLGLLLFTALLPVISTGPLTAVLLVVAFQIGAEAFITRNYWLGTVCVTPMALLLSGLAAPEPAGELIGDRWTDTVVGVAVGLLCCVLVTNRRAAGRIGTALDAVDRARSVARRLLDGPAAGPGHAWELGRARDRLTASLIELREALDIASGEWWQPALPTERAALAEREGHETLAELVRRLSAQAPAEPASGVATSTGGAASTGPYG